MNVGIGKSFVGALVASAMLLAICMASASSCGNAYGDAEQGISIGNVRARVPPRTPPGTLGTFHTQNILVDTNATISNLGAAKAMQIGPIAPDTYSVMVAGAAGDNVPTDAIMSSISEDTNHTSPGIGIDNERINLLIRNNTTFDTTAVEGKSTGIDIDVEGHTSVGGLQTTNTAIYANASTGTSNYCFRSDLGEMRVDGNVNFNAANPVDIGTHVLSFRVPGSTSLTPEGDFGYTGGVDGFNIHIKNTANAVNTTGIAIGGDTSITGASNIAPQIALYRGAGGGFGTGTFGLICMDNGATSCSVFAAANDMVVANYATGAKLFLQSQRQDVWIGSLATSYKTPTGVNHGSLSASATNSSGHITGIGATSVTLTLSTTYGNSHCVATFNDLAVAPEIITVADSGTAPVFSCFNSTTGVASNCNDFTYRCDFR